MYNDTDGENKIINTHLVGTWRRTEHINRPIVLAAGAVLSRGVGGSLIYPSTVCVCVSLSLYRYIRLENYKN